MDELFVVKHYNADERPIIKGNGFDGTEIGEDREDAQALVDWINARLTRLGELEAVLRRVDNALDHTSAVLWKSLKTEVKRALGSEHDRAGEA